jgi:diguanylate cyclase
MIVSHKTIERRIYMKKRTYISSLAIIVFLMFLFFMSMIFSSDSVMIERELPEAMNDSWQYIEENKAIQVLPARLNVAAFTPYSIAQTLNEDFKTKQYILIRTSLQDIKILLDDEVLYEKELSSERNLPPYASLWHIIEIPHDSYGKTLTITLHSPYEAMSGIVNDIYYGSSVQLHRHIIHQFAFRLVIALFVLFMGLVMLLSTIFLKKQKNYGNHHLGLFFILLSLWIIAESRMLQFLTGSQMIIGSLAYLSLPLFPIPIAIYLRNYVIQKYKKPYNVLVIAFAVQFLVIWFAQVFGIADFFESVVYSQALLGIAFVIAITTLFIEAIKHQNKLAALTLKILIIVLVFFLIELLNFILGNFIFISLFALIGVGLFVFVVFIAFIRNLISRLKVSYRNELLESMAYHDALTNAKNRRAFEENMDVLFNDKLHISKVRLVYFDFDDLKMINDLKGHEAGDTLLKLGYECIESTFGKQGNCYRLGGDEFACILEDKSISSYEKTYQALDTKFFELTKSLGCKTRISMGSSIFREDDLKYSDMMKRADQDMYRNKNDHKIISST